MLRPVKDSIPPPRLRTLCKLSTRITRAAFDLLTAAVERRSLEEPRACTQGTIVTELILEHLQPQQPQAEPVLDEPVIRREPKSAKRNASSSDRVKASA